MLAIGYLKFNTLATITNTAVLFAVLLNREIRPFYHRKKMNSTGNLSSHSLYKMFAYNVATTRESKKKELRRNLFMIEHEMKRSNYFALAPL